MKVQIEATDENGFLQSVSEFPEDMIYDSKGKFTFTVNEIIKSELEQGNSIKFVKVENEAAVEYNDICSECCTPFDSCTCPPSWFHEV